VPLRFSQTFVHRYLGECHAAVGDFSSADGAYMQAIQLAGPLDTDVRLGYANMLLRVGQQVRQLVALLSSVPAA
jgi:cytochrome c-type biogenesis protein CcmH/NrfG